MAHFTAYCSYIYCTYTNDFIKDLKPFFFFSDETQNTNQSRHGSMHLQKDSCLQHCCECVFEGCNKIHGELHREFFCCYCLTIPVFHLKWCHENPGDNFFFGIVKMLLLSPSHFTVKNFIISVINTLCIVPPNTGNKYSCIYFLYWKMNLSIIESQNHRIFKVQEDL